MALDTETTGLEWSNHIIGISLAWKETPVEPVIRSCYLTMEISQESQLSLFTWDCTVVEVEPLLEHLFENNTIVFHTATFDYRFLLKDFGVCPPKDSTDIAQLGKCIAYQDSYSLVSLYHSYVEHHIPEHILVTKKDRGNLHNRDASSQAVYARWDAEATYKVYEKLIGKVYFLLDPAIPNHDKQFTRLVMQMIQRGVPVDRQELDARRAQFLGRIRFIVEYMAKTYQFYDLASTEKVSSFVYGRLKLEPKRLTASGRGAVGAEDLEPYIDAHPAIPFIIEHRQLCKCISTWLTPLDILSAKDGHAHTQLDPFGTRSYRMSSKDINLQAMPMKERGERAFGSLHGLFKSDRPGEELWALDLKQAEFRLAAILAPDKRLADVFSSGTDPYKAMSKEIWGTEEKRQQAKQAALSALYEVGPRTFSIKYGVDEDEAMKILDAFRNRFTGLRNASNFWSNFMKKHKYVTLYTGRPRYFGPDAEAQPWKAFNQVVQGGVAEMMSRVMLEVERELPERQVLQIHDSIVMHLPADEEARQPMVKTVEAIVRDILPKDVHERVKPVIPILLDAEKWE